MLDRVRVAQDIARLSFSWNSDDSKEESRASALKLQSLFKAVVPNVALTENLTVLLLGASITPFGASYRVLGVDGSQIYPDRSFAGGELAVLNVGGICLSYDELAGSADFFSRPECITRSTCLDEVGAFAFCPELIDLLRSARELEVGLEQALQLIAESKSPSLVLFDGSMIHQGLMLKNTQLQRYFKQRFARAFELFRENEIAIAWYTSMPQSRTLVNLVGAENVNDSVLLSLFMKPWELSPVFSIVQRSPVGVEEERDGCVFMYFSTAEEIVRVEMPKWLAMQQERFLQVCGIIRDQVEKGIGYPVVLTESHRQAVVSEVDRQSVLQLLEHSSLQRVQTAKMLRKIIIPV